MEINSEEKSFRPTNEECISKNALKKKRKWENIKEANKKKRLQQKQNKRLKKNKDTHVNRDDSHVSKKIRIQMERKRLLDVLDYSSDSYSNVLETPPLQICIDLQFGDKMSEKEISHLANQLRRVYGANKSSESPAKLSLVNLDENKRTFRILREKNDGFENYILHRTKKSLIDHFSSIKEKVIYLTPDSKTPLEHLDSDKIYVIGGLVDDSVQKDTTQSYAADNQIVTARLPIEEYCSKSSKGNYSFKQILTINQVFDILLSFYTSKNWSDAFESVLPHRIGFVSK